MESFEVLGVFGNLHRSILLLTIFTLLDYRMVLRRLLHGRIPGPPGVYRHLSVNISSHQGTILLNRHLYSYLNNPEAMGGAAWFGLALISGTKLVLSLAVIRHLAHWWFLSYVEKYVFLL